MRWCGQTVACWLVAKFWATCASDRVVLCRVQLCRLLYTVAHPWRRRVNISFGIVHSFGTFNTLPSKHIFNLCPQYYILYLWRNGPYSLLWRNVLWPEFLWQVACDEKARDQVVRDETSGIRSSDKHGNAEWELEIIAASHWQLPCWPVVLTIARFTSVPDNCPVDQWSWKLPCWGRDNFQFSNFPTSKMYVYLNWH